MPDRFFGRNEEIAGLVDKLKALRLIAVVADSGAGKSSLVQAGLIPAYRGGKLADMGGLEPDDRLWHVVVMRPGRDPIEGLKQAVTEAAERLGRSADECARLRKRINLADFERDRVCDPMRSAGRQDGDIAGRRSVRGVAD